MQIWIGLVVVTAEQIVLFNFNRKTWPKGVLCSAVQGK
jgi:hypothetical protein